MILPWRRSRLGAALMAVMKLSAADRCQALGGRSAQGKTTFPVLTSGYMLAGQATDLRVGPDRITFRCAGETWLSMRFQVGEEGAYKIIPIKEGGPSRTVLIDGETLDAVDDIGSSSYTTAEDLPPVYLGSGAHSVIFHAGEPAASGDETWRGISVQKVEGGPRALDLRPAWTPLNTRARMLKVGAMFSGTYVNVNIAREKAVFSRGGFQYLSYYHPSGFLVVARRRLDQAHFEKYWLPISDLRAQIPPSKDRVFLSDPHNYISMEMDGAGYLHLAFGHHGDRLRYMRSRRPHDISEWDPHERGIFHDSREERVTYPSFIRTRSGNLLLLFRNGEAGNGTAEMYRFNTRERRWRALHLPFARAADSSPYFWQAIAAPDGRIHLAWTWRLNSSLAKAEKGWDDEAVGFYNKDIFHAQSSDEGDTWTAADNAPYPMPLSRPGGPAGGPQAIQAVGIRESFFNHYGADSDGEGRPHFAYMRWSNSLERITQQWHLHWNGRAWTSRAVSDYTARLRWTRGQCNGHALTDLARPSIVVDKDGRAIILSRARERGNKIEAFVSTDATYGHWRRVVLFDGPVGGWEPQVDRDLWRGESRLHLILLGVTDGAVIPAYKRPVPGHWLKTVASRLREYPSARRFLPDKLRFARRGATHFCPHDPASPEDLPIDARLGRDIGYILEIDHALLRE